MNVICHKHAICTILKFLINGSENQKTKSKKTMKLKWVVVHTGNSSIQVAETTGLRVQIHLGLLSENVPQQPKVTSHEILCKRIEITHEGSLLSFDQSH